MTAGDNDKHVPPGSDPAEPTARMKKERLSRIGPFKVKLRLGQGAMGTVYLCEDPNLDRFVAVKMLRKDLCHEEKNRERFLKEARALAGISDPHVVNIYEVEPGENPYFAMEYVSGLSVFELLRKKGRFPIPEACKIIAEAAQGLKALHDSGIVHRDITPSNILIDQEGAAKIVDFGIALEGGTEIEKGVLIGTPHYMAPEQAGSGKIDYRADIYGLGATFYHMLVGEAPFADTSKEKVLAAKLAGDPEHIRRKRPGVSLFLASVIGRMLSRDPGDRYETCEDLLVDLKKACKRTGPGHLVAILSVILFAVVVAGTLLLSGRAHDLGSIGAVLSKKGDISVDFRRINIQNLNLEHFLKSVKKGGRLPSLSAEGLFFSEGDYEVVFFPLHFEKARLSGMKFMPSRGQLKISFGAPDYLYRSFSCSLKPLGKEIVFRAIQEGRVELQKVFTVGRKLRRWFGNGFDMELSFVKERSLKINFFQPGSRKSVLKEPLMVDLPVCKSPESWQDGLLGLTISSFPQSYNFLLRGISIKGKIEEACIEKWIKGNDSWRELW